MSANRKINGSQLSRRNVTQEFVSDALEELKTSILTILSAEVSDKIEELKTSIINEIINENKKLTEKCKIMQKDLKEMKEKIDYFEDQSYYFQKYINEQQQRSRRNNIEIVGISNEILDENLENECINILNTVLPEDNKLKNSEIDACHRLPYVNGGSKTTIIKFICRKRRDNVAEINGAQYLENDFKKWQNLYVSLNLTCLCKLYRRIRI